MAKFKQAMKWMKEGKRVRRPSWQEKSYWELGVDQSIIYSNGEPANIHFNQVEANDWEIYEEDVEEFTELIYNLKGSILWTLAKWEIDKEEQKKVLKEIDKLLKEYLKKIKQGGKING